MRRNKIGALFLVSVLALAGVGVSYAGFNATITVHGTVDTGTLTYEIEGYSGTWLWKVWGPGAPPDEVFIFSGETSLNTETYMLGILEDRYPNADYELISYAYAEEGDEYDVDMVFHNIFPCTWYWADVLIHYTGSIPVKVTPINWETNIPFGTGVFERDFRGYKGVINPDTGAYEWFWIEDYPIQMHNCNYLWIFFGLHMLQPANVNDFQGQTYYFSFDIYLEQWYDPCNTPPVGDG